MTLTSISLPVHIHPDATHVIYDADGNQVAVCGPAFSELDGSGRLLQQAETIAAELVRVLNAHDELVDALNGVLVGFESHAFVRNTDGDSDPSWAVKLLPHLKALSDAHVAIAAARGEAVS